MDSTNTLLVNPAIVANEEISSFLNSLSDATRLMVRLMDPGMYRTFPSLDQSLFDSDMELWEELIRLGRKHGGMPLIYKALKDCDASVLPQEIKRRMQADFHRIGLLISMQSAIIKKVTQLFEAANIPILFFKGIQLGQQAYGNPIWRKPGDLDVLIHKAHFEPARQILLDLGFDTRMNTRQEESQIRKQQQLTFYGETTDVDVHFSLQQRSFLSISYAQSMEDYGIWKRSEHTPLNDFNIPSLSAEDQFCLLCVHSAKHGWYRLYMVSDIAAFISNVNMNWQKIAIRTKKMKAERMLGLNVLLSHYLFDTPIPSQVQHIISNHHMLPSLTLQILRRLLDENVEDQAMLFHRIQAGLFPRWSEKVRYFSSVAAENWKRKTGRLRG